MRAPVLIELISISRAEKHNIVPARPQGDYFLFRTVKNMIPKGTVPHREANRSRRWP